MIADAIHARYIYRHHLIAFVCYLFSPLVYVICNLLCSVEPWCQCHQRTSK